MPTMPVVLYPTLLWLALLTLVIPIVIHLLSQSRARLVKFSLVGFIQAGAVAKMMELRLMERVLLALRLVFLLLAALLLAQLVWPTEADGPKSHVLVTQDWLAHATPAQKQALAARKDKTKITYVDPAAPFEHHRLNAEQLLNPQQWPIKTDTGNNLWLGLFNYTRLLHPNDELNIYSTDRLQQFSGQRLPITQPLNWQILKVPQGIREQLTMHLLVIYTAQQQSSVTYLRGAMNALDQQSSITVNVTYVQQNAVSMSPQQLAGADWVVYLSAQPPDDLLMDHIHQGGKLLITAAGADQTGHWLAHKPDSDGSITISQLGNPALARHIVAGLPKDRLWQTADGQDLLNQYVFGQGHILAWHSQFAPKWNNLVSQVDFPVILNNLLNHDRAEQVALINGRLSLEQIRQNQPHSPVNAAKVRVSEKSTSWTRLLLILLVALFCAERFVAESFARRTSKKQQVGTT